MTGFTPVYEPPVGPKGACTTAEIDTFDKSCINGSNCGTTSDAGTSWDGGTSACLACLLTTNPAASSWATIIERASTNFFELNIGGCYAAESAAELACGSATQAQLECEHSECSTSVSLNAFAACQTAADTGACKCYVTAASAACASHSSSPCNPYNFADAGATAFDVAFKAMAAVMCGP